MMKFFKTKSGILYLGDCRDVMKTLPDNSVDAVVTDPPAGISFMGKTWDKPGVLGVSGGKAMPSTTSSRNPSCKNCGGRKRFGPATKGCDCETPVWNDIEYRLKDRQEFIDFMTLVMVEVVRVLKPGGHALVWALPRTSHWTATACEDAGFEIRDRVSHLFGQGFPKSLDVGKSIDKAAGVVREVVGTKLGLPGYSITDGSPGGVAIEGSADGSLRNGAAECAITSPATDAAKQWDGWHTALKPACEDWWLCRKPLEEATVAANVLKYGTGAINVDACRVPLNGDYKCGANGRPSQTGLGDNYNSNSANQHSDIGRFPTNLTHDGSTEVLGVFPVTTSGVMRGGQQRKDSLGKGGYHGSFPDTATERDTPGDTGIAARFFPVLTRCLYTPKANSDDRGNKPAKQLPLFGTVEPEVKNTHPTVKPQALMEWLIKLITPPGGLILDCFSGSGSTGVAAQNLGFNFILIEQNEEYFNIAVERLS